MKTRKRYFVAAASVIVITSLGMLLGRPNVVQADDGCTDSTIAGTLRLRARRFGQQFL